MPTPFRQRAPQGSDDIRPVRVAALAMQQDRGTVLFFALRETIQAQEIHAAGLQGHRFPLLHDAAQLLGQGAFPEKIGGIGAGQTRQQHR